MSNWKRRICIGALCNRRPRSLKSHASSLVRILLPKWHWRIKDVEIEKPNETGRVVCYAHSQIIAHVPRQHLWFYCFNHRTSSLPTYYIPPSCSFSISQLYQLCCPFSLQRPRWMPCFCLCYHSNALKIFGYFDGNMVILSFVLSRIHWLSSTYHLQYLCSPVTYKHQMHFPVLSKVIPVLLNRTSTSWRLKKPGASLGIETTTSVFLTNALRQDQAAQLPSNRITEVLAILLSKDLITVVAP